MASYVNMSLDDIIQKKKKANTRNPNNKKKQQPPAKALAVVDARNKIISKKRTQIRDAREKLAEIAKQKDARQRLEQLRAKRQFLPKLQGAMPRTRGKLVNSYFQNEKVFTDPSRFVVSQPLKTSKLNRTHQNRKFTENRSIGPRSLSKAALKPIIRTIENDLEIIDEPMEYEPLSKTALNRKASLQLKIVTHNNIERNIEKEKSPPRPPSILKKRTMAALRSDEKVDKQEKPVLEYRIIVSNLRNSVTGGDIEELFGDVGGMIESRLVRPGTAEVIYKTVEDAQRAVDLYHNRQLDGQPMNCLLVTPRPNASVPSPYCVFCFIEVLILRQCINVAMYLPMMMAVETLPKYQDLNKTKNAER